MNIRCLSWVLILLLVSQEFGDDQLLANESFDEKNRAFAHELSALFRAYRATITKHKEAIHRPRDYFTEESVDLRVATMHKQAKILYKVETKKNHTQDSHQNRAHIKKQLEEAFEQVIRSYVDGKLDLKWHGENTYVSKWDDKLLPARFAARAANVFNQLTDSEVTIKLTTSKKLLVNPDNAPDDWESEVIDKHWINTSAKKPGDPHMKRSATSYRFILPEYYKPGCISCHGTADGQEGLMIHPSSIERKVFDFAGGISVNITKG